jgi:hypothetical protein
VLKIPIYNPLHNDCVGFNRESIADKKETTRESISSNAGIPNINSNSSQTRERFMTSQRKLHIRNMFEDVDETGDESMLL